jgi:chemotaxis signal transduction protein
VDLKGILSLERKENGASSNLIIIRNNDVTTGIIVDRIAGILFDGDQDKKIQKQKAEKQELSNFINSILISDRHIINLLDVNKLMSAIQIGGDFQARLETAARKPDRTL